MALENQTGSAEVRSAVARRLVTVAVVAAMLLPVAANRDGLPLSTYPMYAGTRSEQWRFVAVRGETSSGEPAALSMREIAETLDPLIAQSFLNDAVASGRADTVCLEIAARVGSHVVTVEIAVETHDVIDHVAGEPSLVNREMVARCEEPSS